MTNETQNQTLEEKVILFVDDIWGMVGDSQIPELYGGGRVQGYRFLLEDAYSGNGEDRRTSMYSGRKVIARIKKEGNIDLVLLDMDFGELRGFGEEILWDIRQHFPTLPVIIDSSSEDKKLKERCLKDGATDWIMKTPSAERMKIILDHYLKGDIK